MAAPNPKEAQNMISNITKVRNEIRYTAGRSHIRYDVKEDGIYEEWDEMDQHGEKLQSIGRLVMPKQLFIEAYNAYIKGENYVSSKRSEETSTE